MTPTLDVARPLCVCLDLNVWVASAAGSAAGRPGGSCALLIKMAAAGSCAIGPMQIVVSWRMVDTLRYVLLRLGMSDEVASANVDAVVRVAAFGPMAQPPYLVLGGTGVAPVRDTEDAAVLEVAVAAGANLLVTFDMADFAPGPRSHLTARVIARNGRRPAVLSVALPDRADLIVATPQRAADWLSGSPRPRGVLPGFPPGARARPG